MRNSFEKYFTQVIATAIYSISTIVYCIRLNDFNDIIAGMGAIKILTYDDGKAWFFLVGAITFIFHRSWNC